MYEIFMMFFDPSGELVFSSEMKEFLIRRSFEGSLIFYLVIFVLFVVLCYRVFRNLWKP